MLRTIPLTAALFVACACGVTDPEHQPTPGRETPLELGIDEPMQGGLTGPQFLQAFADGILLYRIDWSEGDPDPALPDTWVLDLRWREVSSSTLTGTETQFPPTPDQESGNHTWLYELPAYLSLTPSANGQPAVEDAPIAVKALYGEYATGYYNEGVPTQAYSYAIAFASDAGALPQSLVEAVASSTQQTVDASTLWLRLEGKAQLPDGSAHPDETFVLSFGGPDIGGDASPPVGTMPLGTTSR